MPSSGGKAFLALALGIAAASALAPQQASAQFFFRPFGFAYRSEAPEETPIYASRRAVAGILGREGFRLIGPLGHRGEQIVAMGVNRREGEMRFIIDPYEGRILRAVRLGPPPMYDRGYDRGPGGEPDYAPPGGGARPYARDLGEEDGPRAIEQPRRAPKSARLRDAPPERPADQRGPAPLAPQAQPPASTAAPGPRAAAQPTKPAVPPPAPPAVSPPPAPDPVPVATKAPNAPAKAEPSAAPTQAAPAPQNQEPKKEEPKAKVESAPKATPPASTQAAQEPKAPGEPAKAEPASKAAAPTNSAPAQNGAKAPEAPPRTTAARSTGGSTKRAIVPPPAASGVTAVTPAVKATAPAPTPPAPATAKTPVNADTPKQGG